MLKLLLLITMILNAKSFRLNLRNPYKLRPFKLTLDEILEKQEDLSFYKSKANIGILTDFNSFNYNVKLLNLANKIRSVIQGQGFYSYILNNFKMKNCDGLVCLIDNEDDIITSTIALSSINIPGFILYEGKTNLLAVSMEALGFSLPYSTNNINDPYLYYCKCEFIARSITNLFLDDIKPRDIITRESINNAIVTLISLDSSDEIINDILEIGRRLGYYDLDIEKYRFLKEIIPNIGCKEINGVLIKDDINIIGGTSILLKYLLEEGYLDGSCLTVTGDTLERTLKYVEPIEI